MHEESAWVRLGRPLISVVAASVVSWFAFVAHHEVPMLDWFDLAVHEAGHLVTGFLPDLVMFLAGSVAQVAFPVTMAVYFGRRRRDLPAAAFCTAWAGASAWDVSVYAADAVTQSLPLVGGGEHDWAHILGPSGFDALHMTSVVAGFIEGAGKMLAVTGIVMAVGAVLFGMQRRPSPVPVRPSNAPGEADPWAAAASLPFRHEG